MDDFSNRLSTAVEDDDIQSVETLIKQLKLTSPEEKQRLSVITKYQCLKAIEHRSLPLLQLLFTNDIFAESEDTKARVNIEFMEHAIKFEFVPAIDFLYKNGFKFEIEIKGNLNWNAVSFSIDENKQAMLKYILCISCKNWIPFILKHELTPLAIAALTCNVTNLKNILNSKEKKNINEFCGKQESEVQLTPLQWCVVSGSTSNMVECVNFLVDAGANVDLKQEYCISAVHMAAKQNLPEVLVLLMDNGADVNVCDSIGCLPLHYICQYPETTELLKCFRRLIKDTFAIDARNKIRKTPFSIAGEAGNCQMVQELADYGCDINVYSLNSTIIRNTQPTKSKMIEKLIHLGSNVNVQSRGGRTPLMLAAKSRDLESFKLLLIHGADVNAQDKHGNSVIDYILECTEGNPSLKCKDENPKSTHYFLDILLQSSSQINIVQLADKYFKLYNNCDVETVDLFVARGFDICHIGQTDKNILHFLAGECLGSRALDKFDHLCDKVNVNHKDADGNTPLIMAAATGFEDSTSSIKYLINRGADVNIVDKEGQTALMMCAKYNLNCIKLLLDAGADVNIVNKEGETALMICNDTTYYDMLVTEEKYYDHKYLMRRAKYVHKSLVHEYSDEYFVYASLRRNARASDKYMEINTCSKLLLEAGSNPNIQDKNRKTVLQYVTMRFSYPEFYMNSLKLFLQYGGAVSLDIKTAFGFTPFQYVLNTKRYSLFWHLLAENCSFGPLKARLLTKESIFSTWNNIVKLGKILYLCGAPWQIIQEELQFQSNDKIRFYRYCNNRTLKELCRRRLRHSIGVGIQQKLSKDCQIPKLFHDFIMLKDIFPAKVFDPNEILESDYCDNNTAFEGITLDK